MASLVSGHVDAGGLVQRHGFGPQMPGRLDITCFMVEERHRTERVGQIERRGRGCGPIQGQRFVIAVLRIRQPPGRSMEVAKVPYGVRNQEGIPLLAAERHGLLVEGQRTLVLPQIAHHVRQCLERVNQRDS